MIKDGLFEALSALGKRSRVLAIPPDFSRIHSQAGLITRYVDEYYAEKLSDILPALGMHFPMTEPEISTMFGDLPRNLFKVHDWRNDVIQIGEIPELFIEEISQGDLRFSWPVQLNKMVINGDYDLILSIGQVVPHEVIGMASYNKNVLIGTGGRDSIQKSHYLGAVHGTERIMGRIDNPVRKLLDYASEKFLADLPIIYVLTVIGKNNDGKNVVRGLYIGDDLECFLSAAALSTKVNIALLERPLDKVVVYLDPEEFKSTWLGNKAIYRSRMAIADEGELVILAPGVKSFGEDPGLDQLIRKYGYRSTSEIVELVKSNEDLGNNLSAAAHLIHGSTDGRFTITYCPGKLSQPEIEQTNMSYGDLSQMLQRYDPKKLKDGFNILPNGEEIFYISNPALGLWTHKEKFK
jgi:nickel-dependent lactate racemase